MIDMMTIGDIRKTGYCVRGSLAHAERLGLDRKALVRVGLPIEDLEKIDDENVRRCVETAKKRIRDEQQ